MNRTLSVLSAAVLAGAAFAQSTDDVQWQTQTHKINVDSGFLHNASGAAAVIFSHTVQIEQANWLVLYFGEQTNLPAGSVLRLTSTLDGEQMRFDANSLADYHMMSPGFNGGGVKVELVAGANTQGNRVVITDALRAVSSFGPESLCGADDRTLSSDPRCGRLVMNGSPGCTAWLINNNLVLTAGHCAPTASRTYQIEFNVPLSSSSGSPRRSGANDVYPLTLLNTSGSGGVGNDWALLRVGANGNTGLTPSQANGGQVYSLGSVPGSTSGQNIRITGYGTVSSPVSPTWNQVQKTHMDRLTQINTTSLRYIPDTTGGNSGSPVIHENTGNAVGIHTHAGCTSGGNQGTRIDVSALQNALRNAGGGGGGGTPGTWSTYGQGCRGTGQGPSFCAGINPNGTGLSGSTAPNEYAYEIPNTGNLTVVAFEVYSQSNTGAAVTVNAAIYADVGGAPDPNPLDTTTITIGSNPGWYRATLTAPQAITGNVYVAVDHSASSTILATLGSGTGGNGFWRRPPQGGGTWNTSGIIANPAARALCLGGGGNGAVPVIGNSGEPKINASYDVSVAQAVAGAPAFLTLGLSDTVWAGGSLPFTLPLTNNCQLFASTDAVLSQGTSANGGATIQISVPNNQALVGANLYHQWLIADPNANTLGWVLSNAGKATIGG